MSVRPLVVVSLALGTAGAQHTLVVDQSTGPFTQISAAIAAAVPGDRIEVHPGNYHGFTVSIGVDIVAPTGVVVGGFTNSQVGETIDVVNVPAANAVRLDGIALQPSYLVSPVYGLYPATLTIRNCAGIVHLHRVQPTSMTVVQSSLRVAASGCALSGLTATDAAVVLDSCGVIGRSGDSATTTNPYPGQGSPGLSLVRSYVVANGCTIVGGNGGFGYPVTSVPGIGAYGADGDVASVLVAVGAGSIAGGHNIFALSIGPQLPGIAPSSTMAVRVGPGVTVSSPPATLVPISEPPHVTAPLALPMGTSVAIQASGVQDQFVLLAIDIWNDVIRLPGIELPFVLTTAASLYALAPPSPAGTAAFPLQVPQAPWLANQFVHFQAVTIDGAGALQCSTGGYGRIQ
jgi:hypothetical protein